METIIHTWSEAVEAWSRQPQNKIHWPKMKVSFEKIFSCLDRKLTCKECTMEVLASAMAEIIAERDDQKRCAAFMLQSLNYAAATYPEDNPMPKFTSFELVNRANEIQQERWMHDVKPSEEKTEQDDADTKTRTVVQLSPDPLQPIAVFGSISEAEKATGIRNIYRAVANYSMAGGFFWCMEGDEEAVAKKAVIHRGGRPAAKKTQVKQHEEVNMPPVVVHTTAQSLSDEDLIEELRLRGFTGELNITKTYKL